MRSRKDLSGLFLAASAVFSGGCATDSISQSSSEPINRISYANLASLPADALAVVSVRDIDGKEIAPPKRFNATALPAHFDWPESVRVLEGPVTVEARLQVNGELIGQFERQLVLNKGIDIELVPSGQEQSLPELAGTSWRVASYGGRQSLEYTEARLSFGEDGVVRGNGGCNQYNARYHTSGSLINIDELSSSRKICFAPVMYQEHSLFKLLHGVERLSWRDDSLLLHVKDIDVPVILTATQSD